jgi:hypothetical protein
VGTKLSVEHPLRDGAKLRLEADTVPEMAKLYRDLQNNKELNFTLQTTSTDGKSTISDTTEAYPSIPDATGCADAIRKLLATDWGRREPRTESEITAALKTNALHYPHGTISGLLVAMTKKQEIRRPVKKHGSYAYVINDKHPEHQDN